MITARRRLLFKTTECNRYSTVAITVFNLEFQWNWNVRFASLLSILIKDCQSHKRMLNFFYEIESLLLIRENAKTRKSLIKEMFVLLISFLLGAEIALSTLPSLNPQPAPIIAGQVYRKFQNFTGCSSNVPAGQCSLQNAVVAGFVGAQVSNVGGTVNADVLVFAEEQANYFAPGIFLAGMSATAAPLSATSALSAVSVAEAAFFFRPRAVIEYNVKAVIEIFLDIINILGF